MLTIPYSPGEDNLFIPGHTNLDTVINRFTIFFFARSLSFALSFSASLSCAPDTAATACHLSPRSAGRFIYLFSFFFSSVLFSVGVVVLLLLFVIYFVERTTSYKCDVRSPPPVLPHPYAGAGVVSFYYYYLFFCACVCVRALVSVRQTNAAADFCAPTTRRRGLALCPFGFILSRAPYKRRVQHR